MNAFGCTLSFSDHLAVPMHPLGNAVNTQAKNRSEDAHVDFTDHIVFLLCVNLDVIIRIAIRVLEAEQGWRAGR